MKLTQLFRGIWVRIPKGSLCLDLLLTGRKVRLNDGSCFLSNMCSFEGW